ncbi:MAG: ABC transporter substrate-binding protein [Ignavibacteriota bacterium]
MKKSLSLVLVLLFLATLLGSCSKKESGPGQYGLSTKNNIVYWLLSDISKLIPYTSHDAQSNYVYQLFWEPLNNVDPRTQDMIPWLASLPEVSADHKIYTYTINPLAKWSDGQPVTGEDVMFSFKTVMDPMLIDASSLRNYLNSVDSISYVGGDKMKVAFYINQPYFMMDRVIGGGYVSILPKHIFDKKGWTDQLSWADLKSANYPKTGAMKELADYMASSGLDRDPKNMIGSGPYLFKEWITNDKVTLKRAAHYWSENIAWGEAYPDEITFKTITDQNAAVTALKAKDIDFMELVNPPSNWLAISQPFIKKDTPYYNVYTYLAWNKERSIFKDKKVRWALSHLVNRDEIITNVLKGMAHKVESPIIFTQPNYYDGLKPVSFDVAEAKRLLAEAGWGDSDGDGILDKVIDGKKTPFKFTFIVNAGNEVRKQVLLIVSEQLRKVGITADVQALEWSVYLENLHTHNFDATYAALAGNASEDDPYQTWHSSQTKNKGSNWHSFINAEADKIMEENRTEFDFGKRKDLMKRFVEVMYDEQPVTFLWAQPQLMARVDRFDNVELVHQRPCVLPPLWVVKGSGTNAKPGALSTMKESANH